MKRGLYLNGVAVKLRIGRLVPVKDMGGKGCDKFAEVKCSLREIVRIGILSLWFCLFFFIISVEGADCGRREKR